MWQSPATWLQMLQNSGSRMLMFRLKPCNREMATDEIQEWKKLLRAQQCKSARVNALTGSVPRKKAEGRQRVWALYRNQTHVSRLTVTRLKHQAMSFYVWLVLSRNVEPIFRAGLSFSDFSSWILTYQGQTRYTRVLNLKPFIDVCYSIEHRLVLKYFLFASMLIEQLIDLRKVRSENLKFRTDLRDRVMDGSTSWLDSNTVNDHFE